MKLLLLAVALPLFAADPAGFQMWTKSELQSRSNGLKLNQEKQAVDRMQTWGNHSVLLERLEGPLGAEAHANMSDMFVIVSGEINLTVGGTIAGAKTSPSGEVSGTAIEGGTSKKLTPGDIAHIPAKMPHQMSVDPGKTCTYLVFKVRSE